MSETKLRTDLPELPARIRKLPLDPNRGYPIPWFVAELPDGSRDFRIMDPIKRDRALRENLCWVCGGKMGRFKTYVIGPMCAVNRTSGEPPCHMDCAIFSATACPFLTRPHAKRREGGGMEDISKDMAGIGIERNPGVTLLWTVTGPLQTKPDYKGGYLHHLGDPDAVLAFAHGREATREEIEESIRTGLPALEAMCQGEDDHNALAEMTEEAWEVLEASGVG